MEHWGINYILSNGEVVKARSNDFNASGAVAKYYRATKNGMPSLDGNGELIITPLGDNKKKLKSAIKAIENMDEKELEEVASGLESMLNRKKAEIGDVNYVTSTRLSDKLVYLDENGRKLEKNSGEWIAAYCIKKKEMGITIRLGPIDYRFSKVSSCINGLKENNIKQLKEVASELKKYI